MRGQGIANFVSGIFGGMAGCALIAESVMNVKLGGKGRLSVLVSGLFLVLLILVMGPVVSVIPVAVLTGVMLMLCVEIFDWGYLRQIPALPRRDTAVMLITMGVAIPTQDLAKGVLAGVVVNALLSLLSWSKLHITPIFADDGKTYRVKGLVSFVTANELVDSIDYNGEHRNIHLDLSAAFLGDAAAQEAVRTIRDQLRAKGKTVTLSTQEGS